MGKPFDGLTRLTARVRDPMKIPESDVPLPFQRGAVEYCVGTEADHEAVYQTLLHVFHGPDRDAFLGVLSDPSYQPEQRLLVKVDGRVVSHLHLTEREVRYGSAALKLNGVMWVGTLPEYRGLGFAQNLLRIADQRARENGVVLQSLTTAMPQFYRPLGWGVCGRHCFGQILSRNLPPAAETPVEGKPLTWQVRPWRQVELGDLMALYDQQYARTTGSVIRSESYWRWMIGRRYAHVIWVACQGETVRGYAFVKDHRILEIAGDPAYPLAVRLLLSRIRAEALERAYPEVTVHAPIDDPVLEIFRQASGRIIDQEDWEGAVTMYHIPDVEAFFRAIGSELVQRARDSNAGLPLEIGFSIDDRKWLLQIKSSGAKVEPDKLGRRYLTLTSAAFVRLVMGHTGIDAALEANELEPSTATAIDAARAVFPVQPIWRSPLDSATA